MRSGRAETVDRQTALQGARLRQRLRMFLSPINAEATLKAACARCGLEPDAVTSTDLDRLVRAMEHSLALYLDAEQLDAALNSLAALGSHGRYRRPSSWSGGLPALDEADGETELEAPQDLGEMPIESELDVCQSRTAALQLARQVGFTTADAVKVATVVSELARNQLLYAERGTIAVRVISRPHPGVEIRAVDQGAGISNLEEVLEGGYRSETGLGLGLLGSQRMMDVFDVETTPGQGTVILARKYHRS